MRKEVGHDISALREETEAIKDASTDTTARINQVEQVFLFVGFVEVDIALQKMSMGDKVNDSYLIDELCTATRIRVISGSMCAEH
jgi:hypothetical protein